MGTIWGSGKSESTSEVNGGKQLVACQPARKEVARIGRDAAGLRWNRAQKFSAIACFALLGILLAVSACSKEESKPAIAGVGAAQANSRTSKAETMAPLASAAAGANQQTPSAATPKKMRRRLAANVTYSDANSGVSFVYPRKAALASSENKAASADTDGLPMNFVQSGGWPVATVSLPRSQYAGTDFTDALFRVSVNHSLSAEECPHFAFVGTSDADGEAIDAEKVKVGSTDMQMTSEFAGNASKQLETRYYHNYASGACYEYILGLSTSGFGQQGVHAVDRDQVFERLEKILASVKIHPVSEDQAAQKQGFQKENVQKENAQKENAQKQIPVEGAAVPDSDK